MARPVLIVAQAGDLHTLAVMQALQQRGVAAEWIDSADLGGALRLSCSLDGEAAATLALPAGRRLSLAEFGCVWWRRPQRPPTPADLDEPTREFIRNEWEHFLYGLEAFVDARWVNSPAASQRASRKAIQLIQARALGLRVPRTLISNDPDEVLKLAADAPPLVYKRLGTTGRADTLTRLLADADLQRLHTLPACPAIFQECIPARLDIRVTVMGRKLYAVEIDSQSGDAPLDWRLDHGVGMRPHELDPDTELRLLALTRQLGLAYGAIDLRLTPEGEYVFLEINPGGQFLFLELVTGLPLSQHLAEFLADDGGEAPHPDSQLAAAPVFSPETGAGASP